MTERNKDLYAYSCKGVLKATLSMLRNGLDTFKDFEGLHKYVTHQCDICDKVMKEERERLKLSEKD